MNQELRLLLLLGLAPLPFDRPADTHRRPPPDHVHKRGGGNKRFKAKVRKGKR